MSITDTKARVYVGTYAKYNNGSIAGKWLDLDDYCDHDEFIEACIELHKDEADPELMFQDYEGFPSSFYAESHIEPELWDWLALDENERLVLELYKDHIDSDGTLEDAQERYQGCYSSERDYIEQYCDDTGLLDSMPENLRDYFDYDSYLHDCKCGGDITIINDSSGVHVFSNY